MAHTRNRFLLPVVHRNLKFWPVLSLLGPRQCGKSTFLRELLMDPKCSHYVSLDQLSERRLAESNPEIFLNSYSLQTLMIDEAHKAPNLFDEIKARVDRKRIPGSYLLSGSVNFNQKVGIRESLTGRTSILRMDTLTLEETLQTQNKKNNTPYNLQSIMRYLSKGGMPGVCFLRDTNEIKSYWDEWLETTCQRDLKVFSKGRLQSDLAYEILEQCSRLEFANASAIANKLRVDARQIKTHLTALKDLFLVREIKPSKESIGKEIYLPFDCGLASHLGADGRKLWQVMFAAQQSNQAIFEINKKFKLNYYLTSRHSFVDFVINENEFHLYCDLPSPDRSALMTAQAALKSNPKSSIQIHCATDNDRVIRNENIEYISWAKGMVKAR